MKQIVICMAALLLLGACAPAAAVSTGGKAALYEPETVVSEPTAAPTDRSFQPNETSEIAAAYETAEPDRSASFFSDTPIRTERAYQSSTVSVSIVTVTDTETYGKTVSYHVADIRVRDVTSIRTAAARGDFRANQERTVQDIADGVGAILAIDGDTYSHADQSFLIRNGELYRDTPTEGADLCVLYRDGRMETKPWGSFTVQEIIDSDPWQVWDFGPALLDENGHATEITHSLSRRNPRAAIGCFEPGHYCFVIVDGRIDGWSEGITLSDLSRLMENIGCKAAYNLDGGASAQMYWNGEIINNTCGKGRMVSDIIYLLPEK